MPIGLCDMVHSKLISGTEKKKVDRRIFRRHEFQLCTDEAVCLCEECIESTPVLVGRRNSEWFDPCSMFQRFERREESKDARNRNAITLTLYLVVGGSLTDRLWLSRIGCWNAIVDITRRWNVENRTSWRDKRWQMLMRIWWLPDHLPDFFAHRIFLFLSDFSYSSRAAD